MENTLSNFDESSKLVIKELVKDNQKLSTLITKLQAARDKMDNRANLLQALTQEIKK